MENVGEHNIREIYMFYRRRFLERYDGRIGVDTPEHLDITEIDNRLDLNSVCQEHSQFLA